MPSRESDLGVGGAVRKEGLLAWEWGLDFSGEMGKEVCLGEEGGEGELQCVGREDHQGGGGPVGGG